MSMSFLRLHANHQPALIGQCLRFLGRDYPVGLGTLEIICDFIGHGWALAFRVHLVWSHLFDERIHRRSQGLRGLIRGNIAIGVALWLFRLVPWIVTGS